MLNLHLGDFRHLMKNLPENSIDLILTDPPYAKEYLPHWSDVADEAARLLKPGGFFVSYSGQYYLPGVMQRLGEHLQYYWLGTMVYGAPSFRRDRGLYTANKPVLIYYKPPRQRPVTDFVDTIAGSGVEKQLHPWQQPLKEARDLIRCFSRPKAPVVDPFAGSGTNLLATRLEGRSAIGYEKEERTYQTALNRLEIRPRNPFLPASDLLRAKGIVLPAGRIQEA